MHVEIRAGENLEKDFLEKGANGRILLLELDDGSHICESVAICHYLENTVKLGLLLLGNCALEQANTEMWHTIVELQGLIPAFHTFRNISSAYGDGDGDGDGENIIASWGEESKFRLVNFLRLLDKQLSKNHDIAGEAFSIVDISALVLKYVAKALEVGTPAKLTNLQRWFNLIQYRPCVQA